MQITEYVCDECGKKRSSDVNHWHSVYITTIASQPGFIAGKLGCAWDSDVEQVDVCGQDCAVKVFSRWLSTGKLKAEVPNVKS